MPFIPKKIPLLGKLNKDADYSVVPEGERVDALNTTFLVDENNTELTVKPVLGNELSYTIPNTVSQNKIIRLKFLPRPNFFGTGKITYINQNGGTIAAITYVSNPVASITMLNVLGLTAAVFTGAVIPFHTTVGVDYFDLELQPTSVTGAEWSILSDNSFVEFTVLSEAIPNNLTGEHHVIGKNLQLNVRFDWSTTQKFLPTPLNIPSNFIKFSKGSLIPSGFQIKVDTTIPHGLSNGDVIKITGAPVVTNANGIWSISIISVTVFELVFSVFNLIGTGATIEINPQGYGQIGSVQYNPNTNQWTYTKLIGTKEFNFVRPKQIDNHVELQGDRYSFYFTDDYNVIRCFYYEGAFINDGAINTINPKGLYNYGSIGIETPLILSNTNVSFAFTQQLQSGGGVLSGNWRYTIRLITENGTATNYLDLINPVNVASASTTINADLIIGDDAGVATPKINQFTLSGLTIGLFKFVELVGVNYLQNSIQAFTIRKDIISGTSVQLQHTGFETVTPLAFDELLQQSADYLTAKNIRAIDRRLILSNLTTSATKDLSSWFQMFTHGLFHNQIASVGVATTPLGNGSALRGGEFQLPNNVYSSVGYMHNETYRFTGKVKFKNGSLSNTFWIDDIIINRNPTNNSGVANPNRRFAALTTYDLTDTYATYINVAYLKFANINFDFIIDGVPVRDLIDELIIERQELTSTTEEILATGVAVIGVSSYLSYDVQGSPFRNRILAADQLTSPSIPTGIIYDYPFAAGGTNVFWQKVVGATFNDTDINAQTVGNTSPNYHYNLIIQRAVASFYSPDMFLGGKGITYQSSDKLFNYGAPVMDSVRSVTWNGTDFFDTATYQEYSGSNIYNFGYDVVNINSFPVIITGQSQTLSSGTKYNKYSYYTELTYPGPTVTQNREFLYPTSNVIVADPATPINNKSTLWDNGLYYTQYYRNKGGSLKFGNTDTGVSVPTGTIIKVNSQTTNIATTNAISVFGGDTFTQKTYYKIKYSGASGDGFGEGISFYSQNKINSQMRRKQSASAANLYPAITLNQWLGGGSTTEQLYYNHGYDIRNQINNDVPFDANAKVVTDLPTRIAWSLNKPISSVNDNYRYFLPLDFHDLDPTQGEIVHHDNFNGELITWQLRALQRQFYNSRGQLQTSTTSIVIGDGSVMSRDGVRITGYGSQHKWSIIKGKSKSGDDAFVWINTETRSAQHLGLNGSDVISETKNLNSWFNKNLTWVNDYDTPADGKGICGVWYENNNIFFWTFMGYKIVPEWYAGKFWQKGEVASFGNSNTFNQTPDFYISLLNNNPYHISNPKGWQAIPHSDRNYYNEYTMSFTDYKNVYSFTDFYSFKPKIYLEWGNTFQSPKPVSNTGSIYLHWEGDFLKWYDTQIEEGYIEVVLNQDTDLIKHLLSCLFVSDDAPYKIDFTTKNHFTELLASDFELLIDQWQAGIKGDMTVPSNPDPSDVWGAWVKIKIYFEPLKAQKITSLVVKFFAQPRLYTK